MQCSLMHPCDCSWHYECLQDAFYVSFAWGIHIWYLEESTPWLTSCNGMHLNKVSSFTWLPKQPLVLPTQPKCKDEYIFLMHYEYIQNHQFGLLK